MFKYNDIGTRVDNSGCYIFMPWEQYVVNVGEMFYVSDFIASGADNNRWFLNLPTGVDIYTRIRARSANKAVMYTYKNPTINANGTEQPIRNMNDHYDGSTASVSVYRGPTVGANGTLVETTLIGAGRVGQAFGATVDANFDRVLLQSNTGYLFNIDPASTGGEIDFFISFYEYDATTR